MNTSDPQYRELAATIATQAQAITDGKVTGPIHAAVKRLQGNLDTLAAWTPDDRSDPGGPWGFMTD
jgi:hypothetical protein